MHNFLVAFVDCGSVIFFCFKQKTAYEMRISDWSSDVCSSDLRETDIGITGGGAGKHMVYLSGVTDHHVQDAEMIEHIVKLVEAKAAEIEAANAAEQMAAE